MEERPTGTIPTKFFEDLSEVLVVDNTHKSSEWAEVTDARVSTSASS